MLRLRALSLFLALALVLGPTLAEAYSSPVASDAFARTVSPGWGTADVGGAWTHRDVDGNDLSGTASTDGSRGNFTITVGATAVKEHVAALGPTLADSDTLVTVRGDGTSGTYPMLAARIVNPYKFYVAQLNYHTCCSLQLRKQGTVKNVWTTLNTYTLAAGYFTANTDYTIRLQVIGTNLKAKVWKTATESEPGSWQATATDSTYASGQGGVIGVETSANTTRTFSYDNLAVTSLDAPTLTVSPTSVTHGTGYTVSWTNIQTPHATDWLAVYPTSPVTDDRAYVSWAYVNCGPTPGAAVPTGSCGFTAPASPTGTYTVRVYDNDSFTPKLETTFSVT